MPNAMDAGCCRQQAYTQLLQHCCASVVLLLCLQYCGQCSLVEAGNAASCCCCDGASSAAATATAAADVAADAAGDANVDEVDATMCLMELIVVH